MYTVFDFELYSIRLGILNISGLFEVGLEAPKLLSVVGDSNEITFVGQGRNKQFLL